MLCAGDELGHSQDGNNNPYCQDNDTTWIDWGQIDQDLIAFTAKVLTLRRQTHPLGNQWYSGLPCANGLTDVSWLQSSGAEMHAQNWNDTTDRVLGCLIGHPGRAEAPLLLLFNPQATDRMFALPAGSWRILLDTTGSEDGGVMQDDSASYPLLSHSVALLQWEPGDA